MFRSALNEGSHFNRSHSQSSHQPRIVISTEAAHGLIVSSAAEKSASLPHRSPATTAHSFLPLPVLLHQPQTPGCPIHRAFCDGSDRTHLTNLNVVVVAFAFAFLVVIPEGSAFVFCPSLFGGIRAKNLNPTLKPDGTSRPLRRRRIPGHEIHESAKPKTRLHTSMDTVGESKPSCGNQTKVDCLWLPIRTKDRVLPLLRKPKAP